MEAIIITKEHYDELLSKINVILSRIESISSDPKETIIDNTEFIRLMNISKRTAQNWRDEQRISFSQVGAKIYYKLSDVEKFLTSNHRPAYKKRNTSFRS